MGRSVFAWASTPASRSVPKRGMRAWTSTALRASLGWGTAARCSSRRRPATCSTATSSCRDLGAHRLKDLTEAQRLYQIGHSEFAPLKSLNRTNLPVTANALVGREQELTELCGLLENGTPPRHADRGRRERQDETRTPGRGRIV